MFSIPSHEVDQAIDRAVATSATEANPERGALRCVLAEGFEKGLAAFAWSETAPTQPGLYAVCEFFGNVKPGRMDVVAVDLSPSGLTFGGLRLVREANPGTLWHRLSELPAQ